MTNGDKTRSMSNEQLAVEFETIQTMVYMVLVERGQLPSFIYKGILDTVESSRASWLEWLDSKARNITKKPDFTNHTGNALDYPN